MVYKILYNGEILYNGKILYRNKQLCKQFKPNCMNTINDNIIYFFYIVNS